MMGGFHCGCNTQFNRSKPTVQEYLRATREQEMTAYFHLDCLIVGLTPSKRHKTSNEDFSNNCRPNERISIEIMLRSSYLLCP